MEGGAVLGLFEAEYKLLDLADQLIKSLHSCCLLFSPPFLKTLLVLSVVSALLCLQALSPSSETSVCIQTAQDLLLGRESSPIWKEHIHSGSVPELISLELIILAQWLLLFVWAACGSRTVPWLLDPSGITSGQLGACLHVAMEMFPLCFPSVSPLEMDGI